METALVAAEAGIAPTAAAAVRAHAAVAVGPALTARPGQAEAWCPGVALGPAAALSALGVARAALAMRAAGGNPVAWDAVLPAYHREPAPVLQRQAALREQAARRAEAGT
jgi:hypothetical protein